MTDRRLTHDTFVLEREYPVAPARAFQAFADPEQKMRWFAGPDPWRQLSVGIDVREGGHEYNEGQLGESS